MRIRLTTLIFSLILGFVATSALYASERNSTVASRSEDGISAPAGVANFPRVSVNQTRPRLHTECADCPIEPGFDDGSDYVEGACNCNRNCNTGATGCSLGSNNQCKAVLGGSCQNCLNLPCN